MIARDVMCALRHRRAAVFVAAAIMAAPLLAAAQVHERDRSWSAPPEYDARANPLASRPHVAAGGARVFRERCSTCHGGNGRGTRRAPDLGDVDVQAQTDGALFWKITSGNTHAGMPAFSFLPEPQRWQLVLHLRTLTAP